MMDPSFWHQRWEKNETGWHESRTNPLLVQHFPQLPLPKRSRIFVPLCGKTLDISWLLAQGCRVAGAELSQLAVEQLFLQLGRQPEITREGDVDRWSAEKIDIFVGDIFALSRQALGTVEAVYDRAALVALPASVRNRYAAHLMQLTNKAPQLLICYEYDQATMEGPPFSVGAEEVRGHYTEAYEIALLASTPVPGGLKGKSPAQENLWRLTRKSAS
jgi:thiopurine S-methyltransferase